MRNSCVWAHAGEVARAREDQTAHLVTTAARSPQADRHSRERRYLILMGIRVVAFVIALVVARGWIRVIAIALALVLPWVAVVIANAGPRTMQPERPSLFSPRRRRIETGNPGSDFRRSSEPDDV